MLEVNQCLLCLNEGDIQLYNEYFNCECKVFFHKDCWDLFLKRRQKCPFCNKEYQSPVNINYEKILSFYNFLKYCIFIFELGLFLICLGYFLVNNQVFQEEKGFAVFFFVSSLFSISQCTMYLTINSRTDFETKKMKFRGYCFSNAVFASCIIVHFLDNYLTKNINDKYDLAIANFFLISRLIITFLPVLFILLLKLLVYCICGSIQYRFFKDSYVR